MSGGAEFTWSVNPRPFIAFLRRIHGDLTTLPDCPFRDGLRRAAVECLAGERERFVRNSAGGGEWAPLAPSTLARKTTPPRKGIMWVTGDLLNSLTPGAKNNIFEALPHGYRAGTADPKAAFHMVPTSNRPARPPVPQPDEATRERMRQAVIAGLRMQSAVWMANQG